MMPFNRFIQAKDIGNSVVNKRDKIEKVASQPSGGEIQGCYLDIIGSDALHSNINQSENKHLHKSPLSATIKKKPDCALRLNVNVVMKAVESNNVAKVLEFIDINKGFVLNITDQYGWNALMCACCAGAKDVVRLLLNYNPDVNVSDKKGNTAFKLAQSKGHKEILKLLNDYRSRLNCEPANLLVQNRLLNSEPVYCDVCKANVDSGNTHFTSTIHLFNLSRRSSVPTSYGIPESNVGFQMLLKTGWDREKGLGPGGLGHKFPPKTMLKQDRAGLGAKKYSSRITHDPNLVANNRIEKQRTLNRRERLKKEIRSKQKERELRRMLD